MSRAEVEMRISLEGCRDVRGESMANERPLFFHMSSQQPTKVSLSISERDARELWTQIGLKLRNLNKDGQQ